MRIELLSGATENCQDLTSRRLSVLAVEGGVFWIENGVNGAGIAGRL